MVAYPLKSVVLILLISGFVCAAAADDLTYNIEGSYENHTSHTFTFDNQSIKDSPQLYIENPEGREKTVDMTYNGEKLQTDVSAGFFTQKGVYNFKFLDNNGQFGATGNLSLVIGAANKTWNNRLTQLANEVSTEDDCLEGEEHLCENEYYQSKMIDGQIEAFKVNGSADYSQQAVDYALADWSGNMSFYACDNFECDTYSDVTGSERQGAVIHALWNAYSATGNTEIKEKAVNYTEESPRGENDCEVWSNDFNCGNSSSQAEMMQGFWKAYQISGNETYRQKAVNLTREADKQNYTSPKIAQALTQAYQITGNSTYGQGLLDQFKKSLQKCEDNCSSLENFQTIKTGLNAYKATGNNYYYRNSFQQLESLQLNCLKNTSANCSTPDIQGEATVLAAQTYKSQKDQQQRFINPILEQHPNQDSQLLIDINMKGVMENPVMTVLDSQNQVESSCSLNNINNSCIINFDSFEQGVYYAKLNSKETTFPRSIPVTYSQRDINTEQTLQNISLTTPDNCDPWNNSYECVKDDERSQSFYIQGFNSLTFSYDNQTFRNTLTNLSTPPYSYVNASNAECLPENESYSCRGFDSVEAGERQGSLIDSLYSSYQQTSNLETKDLAQKYASHPTENGCNVWEQNYDCENSKAQAHMIKGYWEAFEVTGNQTYRNISLELANHSDTKSATPQLATALWETYSWTNNTEHKEQAQNITSQVLNSTNCPDCGEEPFFDHGNMLVEAYQTTANTTYKQHLELQQENLDSVCEAGNCGNSRIQGKAISFTSRTMNTLPVSIDVETSISTTQTQLQLEEQTEVTCTINNTMPEAETGEIQITMEPGNLFEQSSETVTKESLSYTEQAQYQRTLTATNEGEATVECLFDAGDFNVWEETNIQIQPAEENETSEPEPSTDTGGSVTPIPINDEEETNEFQPRTVNYTYENHNYTPEDLNLSRENYSLTQFQTRNCIEAQRTFYKNHTYLEITKNCNNTQEILLIGTTPDIQPENAFRNFSKHKTQAVNYSLTENQTNWTKPQLLTWNQKQLQVNSSHTEYTETNTQQQQIQFELNSKEECRLTRNNTLLDVYNQQSINADIEMQQGLNNITLDCGTQQQSILVNYEKPLLDKITERKEQILLATILAVLLAIIIKFKAIRAYYHHKMFEIRFKRFKKAIEKDNVVKAVKNYNKLAQHDQNVDVHEKILNSDIKMVTGLKMYIMSEMVTDPDINLDKQEENMIKTSINNYITNNPDSKITEKIKENMQIK